MDLTLLSVHLQYVQYVAAVQKEHFQVISCCYSYIPLEECDDANVKVVNCLTNKKMPNLEDNKLKVKT